jgi:putative membrane protein
MINFLSKTLVTAVAVLIAVYLLPGVHIYSSNGTITAIIIAAVLGLLNSFIKPLLIILTIPITLITLGLFLLVINILIIQWATYIVPGFKVDNWFWALLFSLIVSIISSFINGLIANNKQQ